MFGESVDDIAYPEADHDNLFPVEMSSRKMLRTKNQLPPRFRCANHIWLTIQVSPSRFRALFASKDHLINISALLHLNLGQIQVEMD